MTAKEQNTLETDNAESTELELEPGFYKIEGKTYQIEENGDMYELDFDITPEKEDKQSIKNNMEKELDMKKDNTPDSEQPTNDTMLEDNYWKETSQTKLDRSTAMM